MQKHYNAYQHGIFVRISFLKRVLSACGIWYCKVDCMPHKDTYEQLAQMPLNGVSTLALGSGDVVADITCTIGGCVT